MNKKIIKALNEQITKEYYSSYLYLSMSGYFETLNLGGLSHWMQMQAEEEMMHVMKFFTFINDCGGKVEFGGIDKPDSDFSSVKDVFEKTLAHEKIVTKSINDLYFLAKEEDEAAAVMFLQWFVTEQVEEEKNVGDILARINFIKEDPMGILMLEKELAARVKPVVSAI